VKLTTHLPPLPRSRKLGSIHPLLHTPLWCSAVAPWSCKSKLYMVKRNVKLPLYQNVWIQVFLTSALVGVQWSALHPGKGPRYPLDRRLGGPHNRSGRCGDWNSDSSVLQPVTSRYTDWAIPAPLEQWRVNIIVTFGLINFMARNHALSWFVLKVSTFQINKSSDLKSSLATSGEEEYEILSLSHSDSMASQYWLLAKE
jgi:hypothetical protein